MKMEVVQLELGEYRSETLALEQALMDGARAKALPGYLSAGSNSYVFMAQDGKAVLKLPYVNADHSDTNPRKRLWNMVGAYSRGFAVPNVEKMLGWSALGPCGLAAGFIPGKAMYAVELSEVRKEHWACLLRTFANMTRRRVYPDIADANFIYHPENGIRVIDYGADPFQYQDIVGDTPFGMAQLFTSVVLMGVDESLDAYVAACHDEYGAKRAGIIEAVEPLFI